MSGELILLIEDNDRNRRLVRTVLEHHGFGVRTAATATEGLALAVAARPRLILLDIQLPDLDGVTALHRLRAQPATARIPVLALTAYAMSGDRERFLDAGFDGYLAKPIDIGTLAATVRRACDATADAASDGA